MIKNRKSKFLCRPSFDKPIVFCFNHAGGNAMAYQKWMSSDERVDFIPAELPGHGTRISETRMEDIRDVSRQFAKEIAEMMAFRKNTEFSVFGHSLGAIIAFNVVHRLEKKYMLSPTCLQVAGREAPQEEDPSSYRTSMGKEALLEELINYGATPTELLENKEYMNEYVLPIMFSDYKISESFVYTNQKVSAPIVAYYGREDMGAGEKVMAEWEKVTTGGFNLKGFAGGHFFVLDEQNNFQYTLATDLCKFVKKPKISSKIIIPKTVHYERGVI